MLYVFIVSTGTMVKFDMNLAVKKVLELKTEIEKCVHIPVEDQVLLCSGGGELKSENIVGNYYGAGTDTNPIFLFSKSTSDSEYQYNVNLKTSIDLGIEDDVRGCASMSPSSSTATVRAALAQRFAEAAGNGRRECDELVHSQHLQQQGWAAVIANLEDAKDSLIKRKLHFEELYQKYLANRSCYQETIKNFPDDIELLAKVPLSRKLLLGNECIEEDLETEHTLLSWFCSEPRSGLEDLAEKCQKSLEELDEHSLIALNEDICNVLKNADNPDIKEVKGIEERLSLLNKQIEDAKKLEKDQRDLASWFSHTQSRITRDPLVLPDLCGTFQKQLGLMLDTHKCLKDIVERCTKAKMELSESINYRLKYICHVESEMYQLQVRIIFLEKHVLTLMNQIENFRQVHFAPQRYMKLLVEVCRRKAFSSVFMKWATEVSAQTFKLYHKEISVRKSFESDEPRNMVDNLFPGMDDVPPPFAIECPRPFDQKLPNILREDLEELRIRLPELAHFCEVPAPDPMPYISQAESDSAFSSNIPSCRMVGDSADSGGKSQPEKDQTSHKLAAPSGDSLPSEYASLPNEVFSLTSSPFEDPLLPANDLELASKRTKNQTSELLADKSSIHGAEINVESDGEEFETVDQYGPSVEIRPHSSEHERSASAPRPNSTSEVINVNRTSSNPCPKLSKARSDGDAISPIQERLKSSDSMLVSTDFQSTEYYIDDSMPSSYTESNATSPLLRANRMVKSHHVVVAELQKQVEEKECALVGAASSLKNSRSNILKLHAKISALQKYIQELQGSLQSDLSNLKAYVKEEFWERMSEVSQVVENINRAMVDLQKQTLMEKEEALSKAKSETEYLESQYLHKLEVECEKLNDAESQIANYEEYLQQVSSSLEDIKHEREQLECELNQKKEVIKSMMLEHELELDSLRNQMRQEVHEKDDAIFKLSQNVEKLQNEIQCIKQQNSCLEEEIKSFREGGISSSLEQKNETSEKDKLLQEEIKRSQLKDEKLHATMLELEQTKEDIRQLKADAMKDKEKELNELEEKLTVKHRNEMESLRSRYKLAVSTTVMEKSSVDNVDNGFISTEDVQKIIDENHEKWEAEKNKQIKAILEKEEEKLNDAVSEAVQKERAKNSADKALIMSNLKYEYEENLERTRSHLFAEFQVSFNEAIHSVTKEKDSQISALRSEVSRLEDNFRSVIFFIDKYSSLSGNAALSQSDSGASSSKVLHKMDERMLFEKLKSEIEPYLHLSDQGHPAVSQDTSTLPELPKKTRLYVRSKSGPSCIDCTYKVSIFSCDVGDLILLCYEDKHESFVAFHFGQFMHFIHTDSLQSLGLKIPAGPSERWALGVVTGKEFCAARKPLNRYRVTVGGKFYRVKVKPWNREKAQLDYQFHRSSQSAAYTSSQTFHTQSTPSDDEDGAKDMSASAI